MRSRVLISLALTLAAAPVFALDGQIGTHDPSTVIQCDGKFYFYATGNMATTISDDGFTWRRGPSPLAQFDGRIPETVRALSPASKEERVSTIRPDLRVGDFGPGSQFLWGHPIKRRLKLLLSEKCFQD